MMHVETRAPAAALELRLVLTALFLLALLVRVVAIEVTIGFDLPATAEPASDSRIHMALVENLLAGRGFSINGVATGITPPLYVMFLAALYGVTGSAALVRLLQAALGALGCLVLYAAGRRIFGSAVGLLAAVGLSLYPLAVYLTGLHLTENLFLFLLLLLVWQTAVVVERPTARGAVALGVLAGLAALTRSLFVGLLVLLPVWTALVWGMRSRTAHQVSAIALATAALVLAPWIIRNAVVLHAFVPVQSNGGMVFWSGNNAHADGGMVLPTRTTWTVGRPPDDEMYGWRDLSISQENARYVRAALAWISEHPSDYARLLSQKLRRLYSFARATDDQALQVPGLARLAHGAVFILAGVGLLAALPRWRSVAFILLLIVFVNVTTLLFSGATRYVVPMVPGLLLLGAYAVVRGFRLAAGPEGAG